MNPIRVHLTPLQPPSVAGRLTPNGGGAWRRSALGSNACAPRRGSSDLSARVAFVALAIVAAGARPRRGAAEQPDIEIERRITVCPGGHAPKVVRLESRRFVMAVRTGLRGT